MSKSLAVRRHNIKLRINTSVVLLQEIKASRAARQSQQRLTLSNREESSDHASDGVACDGKRNSVTTFLVKL